MNSFRGISEIGLAIGALLLIFGCGSTAPGQSGMTSLPTEPPVPPTATPEPTATAAPGSVEIPTVFNSGYKEYVEIASRSETDRDVTDWTVSGSKGEETFVFPPGYVLAAGATIRLHSGKEGLDAPPGDIYWTDKTIWNNDGETVYLKDASGTVISQYRY